MGNFGSWVKAAGGAVAGAASDAVHAADEVGNAVGNAADYLGHNVAAGFEGAYHNAFLPVTDLEQVLGISNAYLKAEAEHPLAKLKGTGDFAVGGKYGLGVSAAPRPGYVRVGDHYVQIADTLGAPTGGVGKFVESVLGGAAAKRTEEQIAAHVAQSIQKAKSEGYGAVGEAHGLAPLLEPGATTPETAGEIGAQVREGLKGVGAARNEQSALRGGELSKRAGAVDAAMQEQTGKAGYYAALKQLQGEMPKADFKGFDAFGQNELDSLLTHVQQHPALKPFEKIRAQGAILDAIEKNKIPTVSEQKLLERAFGKDVAQKIAGSVPVWAKAKQLGLEVLNIPRAVMASFDLSAPFRQGLVVGVKYPTTFFKNFAPMLKSFGSEKFYQGVMQDVRERPTFPLMQKAKLALTDIGEDPHGTALSQREEQFMSNLAERIPIVGHGIRASDRAYTGFLNKTRADVFDSLIRSAAKQGLDVGDSGLLESIGRFVNSATGRGDLGALQKHAVTLNTLMFSPRLLASRLNFLNPLYYAKLDPFVRVEALGAARNLVSTMGLILYLAKLGGAQVDLDPRNADFAKIKIGNTRIDIAGGFQQPVRLLAQLFSGKVISSTTGKTLELGPQGPGKLSRRDIIQRFFEAKLAPVPSFANDYLKGTTFTGQKFSWKSAAMQRMIPLLAQDATDLYHTDGLGAALGGYAGGAFGVGLQTYGPQQSGGSGGGGQSTFIGGFDNSSGGGSGNFGGGTFGNWANSGG